MGKRLGETDLLQLMPPNMRDDPDIRAASAVVDREFQELCGKICSVYTYADIDNASSEVVDALAIEMQADFYNQSLPLETRRKLVNKAYLYKFTKGTPFAVQGVVSDAFSNAEVREWFEYGGAPYHFHIVMDDDLGDKASMVIEAVNAVKNVRSWCDGITTTSKIQFTEYHGCALRTGIYHIIKMPDNQNHNAEG